jgi:hypothetical protein
MYGRYAKGLNGRKRWDGALHEEVELMHVLAGQTMYYQRKSLIDPR